ncbi:hypothetical protein Tco_1114000 [Tanacetum coccineum]|uniref:Uncharacterized protein n=1 Tax=Tanacetum coccineum TaxID=301880 RepID=A0ABQ5IW20_9ASTR
MRMRQYICHTDNNLWDVIVNGDLEEEPASTGETSAPFAPKTAKQLAADKVIIEDWNSDDEDDVSEVQTVSPVKTNETQTGNPEILLQDHVVVDSGCSSNMTGNKAYLSDYEDTMEALWLLEVIPKEFNLFSVSQMCDKKNSVLFTETECLILSPSFKLLDEGLGVKCVLKLLERMMCTAWTLKTCSLWRYNCFIKQMATSDEV